jgi:hypothetical protein
MKDDYSDQPLPATCDKSVWNEDKPDDFEDEKTPGEPSATEMKFLSVMSEREMEILTTWFPKSAQTLACVLRNRPQWLEDESKILFETR